ncbi:glycoside hydrolase [Dendrothele bispora CBS 962.96]|uniref:Glycoside hydrolase n=1 Tax=Dendrothele bispora (strain CBS 962.96) TaxID=1314807 RepID=A0A4S8L8S0_DENBC|nr:glycoside hydrolase [Dendrothele bispora CBS 962.96]
MSLKSFIVLLLSYVQTSWAVNSTSTVLANTTMLSNSAITSASSPVPGSTTMLSSSTITTASTSVFASTTFSNPATITAVSTVTATAGASFPPIGSISRDFSPSGLEELWDVVGPVEPPPFTTTVIPETPVVLPSPPPRLYPSFYANSPKDILPDLKFPEGFFFGVDTAAYQVEGAVKDEGKGPSMWDWASRQPDAIADNTTADIVDLQYFLYKEDVARVAALGVNAHSFSISWARILPFGTADSPINQEGVDHYRDLINYHLESGIEPVVTLFHWDLPLALQAYYGGFSSPKIVDDFVHYAKTVFKAYNGSVNVWYTFNEPNVYCGQIATYPFNVTLADGLNATTAPFHCAYYLLKAHAGAVKAFREMGIVGEIAFKNDDFVGVPWRTNSTEDSEAVERHAAFQIGIFSDPVYTTGDWPQIMKDTLSPEILPRFTEEEKADILGTADFFAIDCYRQQYISAPDNGLEACLSNTSDPNWPRCNVVQTFDSNAGWNIGAFSSPGTPWLEDTSRFLRGYLKDLQARWPTNKIIASEFGFTQAFESQKPDLASIKEDTDRINYLMSYLGEMLLSIHEDKIPLKGAFIWAMVDNAEWGSGLNTRFGIQYVNYTTLERSYKRSAIALSEFFEVHLQK